MTTMTHPPPKGALSEQELIDVCERYGAFIYQRAFHYVRTSHVAESISAEVLMHVKRRGRQLLELKQPKQRVQWLDMVILRAAVAWLRGVKGNVRR